MEMTTNGPTESFSFEEVQTSNSNDDRNYSRVQNAMKSGSSRSSSSQKDSVPLVSINHHDKQISPDLSAEDSLHLSDDDDDDIEVDNDNSDADGEPLLEQAASESSHQRHPSHHYQRSSGGQGSDSSSLFMYQQPPANPFFAAAAQGVIVDDTEASDGSIVFNSTPPLPVSTATEQQQYQFNIPSPSVTTKHRSGRDRFPSFDSVGSSGSLVKKSAHPRSTANKPTPPHPSNRKILPYHERRKLMQKRQEEKEDQKNVNNVSRDPTPPRPGRLPVQPPPPFVMPPYSPNQQPPFYPQYPGFPPPPQAHHFPFPPMPYAPNGYPPPPHMDPRQLPPPQYDPYNTSRAAPPRPPSTAAKRPVTTEAPHALHSSSSYEDSSEAEQLAKPPPPPPPPPPLPTTHVRQGSTGSVSSLGSHDRSGRDDEHQKQGFFDRLNPWSQPQVKHNVTDFHRKNQAFLSRIERQPTPTTNISPRQLARRVPLNSMDRPPPSRGGHRRLNSIENDDWTESGHDDDDSEKDGDEKVGLLPSSSEGKSSRHSSTKNAKKGYGATEYRSESSSGMSSSGESSNKGRHGVTERTRLLPPSGISTNEYADRSLRTSSGFRPSPETSDSNATMRVDNTTVYALYELEQERLERERRRRRKKKKKKKQRRARKSRLQQDVDSEDSSSFSSASASSRDYNRWLEKRATFIQEEKAKVLDRWRKEARAEIQAEIAREKAAAEENRWDKKMTRDLQANLQAKYEDFSMKVFKKFAYLESFFANLPLTIGAIALSTANLGVDWFKFAEENMDSCEPVHFHSKQCTFPEFPGCFYCDTHARMFRVAEYFHFACSCVAGLLAMSLLTKLLVARRVVFDELSSPTTATPAGLLCMTLDIVFAGRGLLGKIIVCTASSVHLCLAIWFMYVALAYHILPEPSWFPNTTGIGISAVKTWLYFPTAGHFLMAISLTLNFFFFPMSLVRVFLNKKISATVGWMQMSAPNVSLYALTIMAQPSFEEENPDINSFQKVHRMVYLPCMHVLFFLCILGITASIYSLRVRWKEFKKVPFSPAHAAFCAPCLSHANAVQAYRAAVISFSDLPTGSPYLLCLYAYWVMVLIGGTCVTVTIASRYLMSLPKWTHPDIEGEIEPPAPYETAMTLSNMVSSGDIVRQPFVSPAILQANETGTLVLTRDEQGKQKYVRTRNVTALGFEPIMNVIEMEREREILLDWVGKNAPRRRNRTLSVPGIDFSYGASGSHTFGTGNAGVYGMEEGGGPHIRSGSYDAVGRPRSNTMSPRFQSK